MPSPEALRASLDAAGPRAPYPVASLQTVAAFDWAWAHAADFGASTRAIGIGGASAGGNLAAGAALRLRDRDAALPSGQVLVYPVLHHVLPAPDEVLEAQLADLPGGLRFTQSSDAGDQRQLPGRRFPDQYAFPAGAELRGSVPALIVTSEIDDLRPSGEGYAAELAAAGVDVEITRERGALHGFLNMPGHPSATRAVERIARFLRRTGELTEMALPDKFIYRKLLLLNEVEDDPMSIAAEPQARTTAGWLGLEGARVLVAGAGGIGGACALAYVEAGASVAVVDRDRAALEALAERRSRHRAHPGRPDRAWSG